MYIVTYAPLPLAAETWRVLCSVCNPVTALTGIEQFNNYEPCNVLYHILLYAPGDIDELRSSLRRGPRGSRVDRLVEHHLDEHEATDLSSFRIEGAW